MVTAKRNMKDNVSSSNTKTYSYIMHPTLDANKFKHKPSIFIDFYDTLKMKGVTNDAIRF